MAICRFRAPGEGLTRDVPHPLQVVLLGNADNVVLHLCHKLGWDLPPASTPNLMSGSVGGPSGPSSRLDAPRPNLKKRPSAEFEIEPRRVGNSHVWLFEGAEGGKWVDEIERKYQPTTTVSESTSAASTPLSSPPESEAGDTRQMKKARVH
ncbi:hypothetical protein GSI_13054 [Ganoderma sinense ZZ0214-1]|uniref:Uncharacterized protein n=1 Tax=Ganoderma sinense ZZ0214-1 TaxID=1077348 RepID=A0A2G8RUH6_9APHY|nr:hypothetical protein GSI_13054 [Ganoderma sinense ZZ0214-1]